MRLRSSFETRVVALAISLATVKFLGACAGAEAAPEDITEKEPTSVFTIDAATCSEPNLAFEGTIRVAADGRWEHLDEFGNVMMTSEDEGQELGLVSDDEDAQREYWCATDG